MSQATLDRDPSRRVLRWRRYDRALAAAIAAAVLVFGIGIHAWLTDERVFANPTAIETAPVPVGHTLYAGLGPVRGGQPDAVTTINLRSIAPLITENTAGATVNILECEAGDTGAGAGLIAGGVLLDDVATYCPAVDPIHVGTITVGPRANGFVLAITPRHSGVVRVDGARMSYRIGMRSGRQRIGAVRLTANTP
jgi:hypothetical protein